MLAAARLIWCVIRHCLILPAALPDVRRSAVLRDLMRIHFKRTGTKIGCSVQFITGLHRLSPLTEYLLCICYQDFSNKLLWRSFLPLFSEFLHPHIPELHSVRLVDLQTDITTQFPPAREVIHLHSIELHQIVMPAHFDIELIPS